MSDRETQPSGMPVLVAEDDNNDGVLLELAFSHAGLDTRLYFVGDGQEAIDYLGGKPPYGDRKRFPMPHLFLLDLKMPRVDGLEVLQWLTHQSTLPNMFVVVMTGSEDPSDIVLSYAFGADACLPKPCDPARFHSMVDSLARYCLQPAPARRRRSRARYVWPDNLFALAKREPQQPSLY